MGRIGFLVRIIQRLQINSPSDGSDAQTYQTTSGCGVNAAKMMTREDLGMAIN
jgi:hypothetical protein